MSSQNETVGVDSRHEPSEANTRHEPTPEEALDALRDHVVQRAAAARQKHGPVIDRAAIVRLLADPECVRFQTRLVFDADALMPGEFGHAACRGDRPSDGFDLIMHPRYAERDADLPLLIAYHIVSVNWLDVVTHVEAELYGAALFGLDVETYYAKVCTLADELGSAALTDLYVPGWVEMGQKPASTAGPASASASGGGGCGTGCGCAEPTA